MECRVPLSFFFFSHGPLWCHSALFSDMQAGGERGMFAACGPLSCVEADILTVSVC